MNKKEIRKKFKQISLVIKNKDIKSVQIVEKLYKIAVDYKVIALFYPLNNEVNVLPLINQLLKLNKVICLPKIIGNSLEFYQIKTLVDVEEVHYGNIVLKEPNKDCCNRINKNEIEICFIPGLGFDINLNRIGHGKGYYDSYLKDSKFIKIGVTYTDLVIKNIPTDDWDIKMDKVISESIDY